MVSYTLNENGKALTETKNGVTMPADNSFDVVNDFVHSIEASFEDMQSLCLGLAAENDKLRTELEKEAELTRHTERKYRRMLKEREDAHFAELEKERERVKSMQKHINDAIRLGSSKSMIPKEQRLKRVNIALRKALEAGQSTKQQEQTND